ncbi:hypothetical protein [Alteromonas sp. BMJM2]|uniref:hypothetical protein n=1 Tax=Alteromonas sp. BMJM2 TaxID=2954241 RepID=UPI0022B36A48|nr:hypothetical protein [Alteromonas sp. BMJM2]
MNKRTSKYKVFGLKDYTPEDIESLKKKHPLGYHATHREDGTPLPFNGVFYSIKPKRFK